VDNAGNVSTPLLQYYYFNKTAPSPPTNLVVTPEQSAENSFAFSWARPDSFTGQLSDLKYYYSINTLPTENNVVMTSATYTPAGPFATQKGLNRFYVVAQDGEGNINYDLFAVAEFMADTSAPGVPGNIQIFDTSDRGNAEYSIAIKWTKPVGLVAGNFDGYVVYRSTDNITFTEIAKSTGLAYVDSGLESKQYYYYIKTKDKTNNYSIASTTVDKIPTGRYTVPPKLVGIPEVSQQAFLATFKWTTDRVASSFIEYGKTISLGETTGQVDSVTGHEVIARGLEAGTKYFYRAKYIDPDGNIGTSDINSFSTLPPPVISEVKITEIKLDTALVSWQTNTSATCELSYGIGNSSSSIKEESGGSSHIQKIDKLSSASDYKLQISCVDGDNNSFSSDEYSFITPEEPTISNLILENKDNVDLPTVNISYTTNVPTTTLVYYKSASETTSRTYLVSDFATEHSVELAGLEPAIEYTINITGQDANGISLKSIEQKLTTRADSRPPEIVMNRSMGRVSGRGKSAQANLFVRVETDEPSHIKVLYAKGIVTKSFEQSTSDDTLNTYHLVTIPAEAGQVYSYQIEALDAAGNKAVSDPITVPIEQARANATEVITSTFLSYFGWIGKLRGN
jgi:hypothetical protein